MWNWEKISKFFWTKQTYKQVFGIDYSSFRLFDGTHLCWLGIAAALCLLIFGIYKRLKPSQKRKMLVILVGIMLFDELLKYVFTGLTGQFEVHFLPFHLCSINIFVCLWYVIRPNRVAANILYCVCLPAAIVALVMPSWTTLPMWNLMALHSESIHILLAVFPLLLFADGFRPNIRTLPGVSLFLFCASIPAMILNKLFDTNFMFLNGTDGNPVLELSAAVFGEKLYVIGLLILLMFVVGLMYLPWLLSKKQHSNTLK